MLTLRVVFVIHGILCVIVSAQLNSNNRNNVGVMGFIRTVLRGTIFGQTLNMLPPIRETKSSPLNPNPDFLNQQFIEQIHDRLSDMKDSIDDHVVQTKITEIHRPYENAIERFIIDLDAYLGHTESEYYRETMEAQCLDVTKWPYKHYYTLSKHTHHRDLRAIANYSSQAYQQLRIYILSMISYAGVIDKICWSFYQNRTAPVTRQMKIDHIRLYAKAIKFIADIRVGISLTDFWLLKNRHENAANRAVREVVDRNYMMSTTEQSAVLYQDLKTSYPETAWAVICLNLFDADLDKIYKANYTKRAFHSAFSDRQNRRCIVLFTMKSLSPRPFGHVVTDDADFDLVFDVNRVDFTLHRVERSQQLQTNDRNLFIMVLNNADNALGMRFDGENFQEFDLQREGETRQRILIGWEDGDDGLGNDSVVQNDDLSFLF